MKGIKMSGGQALGKSTEIDSNGDFDKRLIQLQKNLYTKVSESKAIINEHIENDHRQDDIFKFLSHTRRGRLLCWLLGYREAKKRRRQLKKKKRKADYLRRKISEV
jgi:hypothetical protein